MIELSKYIWENYPDLKNRIQYWQLLSLLDRNEDKIVTVKEDDKFKGTALYVKISDETLWKIEWGFLDLKNPIELKEIFKEKGNNIHFLYLLAKGQKIILKGLKEVIRKENPDTVSWFNPEMTELSKFNLRRRKLCQSQL